ncbi:hypothetical protein LG347_02305 [Lactiplantibacillus plantarum]|uniref:hypothetical protein n=1 Tax=Lactiplantibacillus plantarum TaxID=1590 RepID=UPI001D094CEB|nr:hypothetical protein [Lactiplantibacillus plantarum]MCB7139937.1 hypothetical protein [Lactiplantibacillus plantarum]MCB7157415.1 hypothetical protein [Lactiplantibacillus plantarum]MCB7165655.1 hypothetical protein [Lactiplantibacillus plantarum]MCB7167781.1 hypothetical protein [Lactiplantibacillus plantarum]MCB7175171.1 hypothetical protein [Lactiplantibacillus plantarum]
MSQFKNHNLAKRKIKKIEDHPENFLIIHYSCQSFFNLNGKTPHITAIGVKDISNGQTKLFCIHQMAEIKNIPTNQIKSHYDDLEKILLRRFYQYVKLNRDKTWIHWNMRNSNFGFDAINQRYRVLHGKPEEILDSNKVDLSELLIHLYGKGYIGNPRIKKLMEKNHIKPHNFLDGEEEAKAFKNQDYVKLSFSTLEKLNIFHDFLNQAINNTLKVNSSHKEIYGNTLSGYYAFLQDRSWGKVIFWILNSIAAGVIGALISHII